MANINIFQNSHSLWGAHLENQNSTAGGSSPATMAHKAPAAGTANKATVTVNKEKYNKLVKEHKQWGKDIVEAKKQLKQLEEDLKHSDNEVREKDGTIADFQEEMHEKDNWITKANASMKNQQTTITELEDALRKSGTAITTNRKDDLVTHVTKVAKSLLFRNWKFLENEQDLVEATTDIIPMLKIPIEMTEEAFIPLYKDVVMSALGVQRQYVQGEGKKRCEGTSDSCVRWLFL